ncbi:hypothetical protein [Streptomyces sp. NPDC094149]|uniref:hypothetical protein n=1 Tax=Streptomyces sp. NPDC094149 TaxID=3155079 RepID=UPI00331D8966
MARYGHAVPHTWGFDAPGVIRVMPTASKRHIVLTFDACGGPGVSALTHDARLAMFLVNSLKNSKE